jgi:hypothetical protein
MCVEANSGSVGRRRPRPRKRKWNRGQRRAKQYIAGFLAGQAVAYCERVSTGCSLIAQLVCSNIHVGRLTALVAQEGCKSTVERHKFGRSLIWIYRDELAKRLIDDLQSVTASELGMWSMGKLFGYADHEVFNFIKRSR